MRETVLNRGISNKGKTLLTQSDSFWKKQYEGNVPHFAKNLKSTKLAHRFAKEMKDQDLSKGSILEIGMGNGRDSRYFEREGFSVIGIDIVPEAVKMADSLSDEYGVVFTKMNVEHLQYGDRKFDGIYSVGVLHSTNIDKSFKEIKRVLKQKGLFMAMMFLKGNEKTESKTLLSNIVSEIESLKLEVLDLYVTPKEEREDEHDSVTFLVQK